MRTGFLFVVGLSSSESLLLLDGAAFLLLFERLTDWTVGLVIPTGFLFVGTSSSSESLLLDEAAFLTGCWVTGLVIGVDLTGTIDAFLFVSSSDESESDDESFFLLLERAAGDGTTAFFATGGTFATHKRIQ